MFPNLEFIPGFDMHTLNEVTSNSKGIPVPDASDFNSSSFLYERINDILQKHPNLNLDVVDTVKEYEDNLDMARSRDHLDEDGKEYGMFLQGAKIMMKITEGAIRLQKYLYIRKYREKYKQLTKREKLYERLQVKY